MNAILISKNPQYCDDGNYFNQILTIGIVTLISGILKVYALEVNS